MKNASIVLFGDSYTAGRIPHTQTDGAFRKALLGVYRDYALSGSTAVQWAGDIDGRLTGVCDAPANIAVGSLLGNDAFAALADGQITLDEALPSLAALALVLSRISREMPVLLMLYPNPFMGVPAVHPEAEQGVQRLNAAISAVAQVVNSATPCGLVMLLNLGTVLRPEHFDGLDIHPNEAGYQAMGAAVLDLIERM